MIKTAVFVEGQAELIFTRELILKFFEYKNIWVECYTLFNDQELNPTEYSYKSDTVNFYFQILNIGNDNKVLSSILKREKYLFGGDKAFHKIVGLRDMYSKEYRDIVKKSTIDSMLNQKFIENHNNTILEKSRYHKKISFHFAIMELEAWLLGIQGLFEKMDHRLTNEKIAEACRIDLFKADPETAVFHPAHLINDILHIIGASYTKKKDEINKFMSYIERDDFARLLNSEKCQSFTSYCNALVIK
uniref:DUF4276 family protein n=1 Tax=Chlorobium chlorochromatii (strain CaD3) TaxID=340177 RepID=Q3AS83_CHLCH